MRKEIDKERLTEAAEAFETKGKINCCARYGSGHINDTFRLECEGGAYILQRMNTQVFSDPEALMRNISGVTSFLRTEILKRNGDPERETLNLIPARDGGCFYVDSAGDYWRMYQFIEGASCYDLVKAPEDFHQSGKAFGRFQGLLASYPAESLAETIPDFHNTPKRFLRFQEALEKDAFGRKNQAEKEIRFVAERAKYMGLAMEMLEKGELPLRVTHNDTKLNNVMIDDRTKEGICVIDLDTVMPGLSIFDFGDSIRFGASTALEDEQDLSKVSLSLELFEVYARGFLEGCGGRLTEKEISMLSYGAWLMTIECGMRFLTDFLEGDWYFRVAREGHNLDRCRTQLKLAADMEAHACQMKEIIQKIEVAIRTDLR